MAHDSEQAQLSRMFDEAWNEGLWAASWKKSLGGLTAEQAAWTPTNAPGVSGTRHSIWQIMLHMCFWREDALRRLTDPSKPSETAVAHGNFPLLTDTTEQAWAETKSRFEQSQQRIVEALSKPGSDISRFRYILPHDCYHFGQINLIRAMLGLSAII